MYIDSGRGYTAATIQSHLDDLLAKTVKPADLHRYAIDVETVQGQLAAAKQVEEQFADLDAWAGEKGFGLELLLAYKFNALAKLALRRVDDTWSGRNNDARRAFFDGWQDVLSEVQRNLSFGPLAGVTKEVTA